MDTGNENLIGVIQGFGTETTYTEELLGDVNVDKGREYVSGMQKGPSSQEPPKGHPLSFLDKDGCEEREVYLFIECKNHG